MHVTTPHEASRPHKRTSKVLAAIQGHPCHFWRTKCFQTACIRASGETLEFIVGNWAVHVVDTVYFLEVDGADNAGVGHETYPACGRLRTPISRSPSA